MFQVDPVDITEQWRLKSILVHRRGGGIGRSFYVGGGDHYSADACTCDLIVRLSHFRIRKIALKDKKTKKARGI